MAVDSETNDAVALIVADDLTGACDAGVHFAARGVRAQVALSPDDWKQCDAAVVACNTHTRCVSEAKATLQLEPVLDLVLERRPQILMKKIDSTLRGPVEREIGWMLERLGLRLVVLAAAFPGACRVVRGGRVRIQGSEFEVDIATCFPRMRCAHVGRAAIGELPQRIAAEMERGTQVLIVDAETNADLREIARAERDVRGVLWAGSGGLARALAADVGGITEFVGRPEISGPVLVCVGSDHCVTLEQVRRLEQGLTVERVRADESGLAAARRALAGGVEVLLEFTREQIEGMPDAALGVKAGVQHCGAMVVTGGDTAIHVLRSLGVKMLEMRDEIEPGIPWGEMQGGEADGKVVVTKSGGFGGRDSLLECVKWLHPAAMPRQQAEAL